VPDYYHNHRLADHKSRHHRRKHNSNQLSIPRRNEEAEQGVPYNRYQPPCRRSLAWFHSFTPVSTLAEAGSGVCTLTFATKMQLPE
jgi:hypothetical protein